MQINYPLTLKNQTILFLDPDKKRQTFDIKVTLSNRDIIQVKETVFLGVILDEHLTGIPHITNVARKVSKTVGVMYKASFFYFILFSSISIFTILCQCLGINISIQRKPYFHASKKSGTYYC